jgi:hypothetical protein
LKAERGPKRQKNSTGDALKGQNKESEEQTKPNTYFQILWHIFPDFPANFQMSLLRMIESSKKTERQKNTTGDALKAQNKELEDQTKPNT